ncbi:MAG: response regulator transcription factor [Acidobacteriota bacterium]
MTLPPAAGRPARVLLADDHAVLREGLVQILAKSMPHASFGEARSGEEALELVRRERWDLVLLDITLPDRNGIEVLKDLRHVAPEMPVLMLTMHPEDEFAVRALKAGAAGYVMKNSDSDEIARAVERVLTGGRYITDSLAQKLAAEFGRDTERMPHERLSDREFEVFGLLARGHTVKDIAARLKISVQTVSTYRARVFEKTGMKSNAEIVQYAIRQKLSE